MKYSFVYGIVRSSMINNLKFDFAMKILTNEELAGFKSKLIPIKHEGKELCKRMDLYMEKILKREDLYKLLEGWIPDMSNCGGAVYFHIEGAKDCELLPDGDYIVVDNILKANATEEMLSFIINHEKYHVITAKNKKKQNEAACDEFAFKQIGAIDEDGNMDTDKVCEIYTELIRLTAERNKVFLETALTQNYCDFVPKSIKNKGCSLDEVKTEMIQTMIARANKIQHNKYNDVKFVYDKTTHKVIAVKTNRKLTKGVKIVAGITAVAALAAGVIYLVKEN